MDVKFHTVVLNDKSTLVAAYGDGRAYYLVRMLRTKDGGREWWDEWQPLPDLPI